MPQEKAEIVYQPTLSHLHQLKAWLKEERENTGEGFYCNWGVIERAFSRGQLICASIENNAVGLLLWWQYDDHGGIDILEVHPQLRRKDIGRCLVEAVLKKFKKDEVSQVSLECQPPTSASFWRRLGFLDDPTTDTFSPFSSKKLYRMI